VWREHASVIRNLQARQEAGGLVCFRMLPMFLWSRLRVHGSEATYD